MKKTVTWKVSWSADDRGSSNREVYVTTEAIARELAEQPWGFCGSGGSYKKHVIYEAENSDDVKKLLRG